jgi:hypothetical protein
MSYQEDKSGLETRIPNTISAKVFSPVSHLSGFLIEFSQLWLNGHQLFECHRLSTPFFFVSGNTLQKLAANNPQPCTLKIPQLLELL